MIAPFVALAFFALLIGALVWEEASARVQDGYQDKRLGATLGASAGAGAGIFLWVGAGGNPLAVPFLAIIGVLGWRYVYSRAHRNVAVNTRGVEIDRRRFKNYLIVAAVLALCLVVYVALTYGAQAVIVAPLSVLVVFVMALTWVCQLAMYNRRLKTKVGGSSDAAGTRE